MLKVHSTDIVRLLLVGLLATMLAISILGATIHTQTVDNGHNTHFTLFQPEKVNTRPAAILACDGGGSDGGCGG